MTHHDDASREATAPLDDLAERLQWLLRLRWVIVPVFVACDLASDVLVGRRAPWGAVTLGVALLAANGVYAALLSRRHRPETLLRWARFESAVVVAVPIVMVALHADPASPLRYGALIGVVGAAVVLRRPAELATVALWACASLVLADALALRFDPAFVTRELVARWAVEAGVVGTVAAIAAYLLALRERAVARVRALERFAARADAGWRAAFDGVTDLVVATDDAGVVVRANRSFADAVGLHPRELVGQRLDQLLAGHPERWWTSCDGACEIEDPVLDTTFEVRAARVDGGVVRCARDVGAQRRLYARLVQADKLAAVGILASGVAHEINNPTASVTSNLAELARYVGAYERVIASTAEVALACGEADRFRALLQEPEVAFARREAQGAIAESAEAMERIGALVKNLRSLARRDQAGEPLEAVALHEVLDAVVRTAGRELRAAKAQVEIERPVFVTGRRGELVDVVLNLVVNAIQARDEARPNQLAIALRREASSAVVRVTDTGKGIAPAHVKRLFEPFFTTKAAGEGTGLGLALARNIVLAHGGTIDVTTALGEGTTFTVRLPAAEAPSPTSAAHPPPCEGAVPAGAWRGRRGRSLS